MIGIQLDLGGRDISVREQVGIASWYKVFILYIKSPCL